MFEVLTEKLLNLLTNTDALSLEPSLRWSTFLQAIIKFWPCLEWIISYKNHNYWDSNYFEKHHLQCLHFDLQNKHLNCIIKTRQKPFQTINILIDSWHSLYASEVTCKISYQVWKHLCQRLFIIIYSYMRRIFCQKWR